MIQPDEIRQKAERLYPSFLKAWLEEDETFFPRVIRSNKQLINGRFVQSAEEVQRLRNRSREVIGYGYVIEWQERRSREFGLNQFPIRITFETQDDFLRFINKTVEFGLFEKAAACLRAEFPALVGWVRTNRRLFIESAGELESLLHVIRYFRDNPRPNRFARELPIPVDTKFIERHESVLRQWLDIVLPPDAIRAGEVHFGRRYGLMCAEPHWLVRLLDRDLQAELRFPCSEFSVPLATLAGLRFNDVRVFIVENKVNLLTLPPIRKAMALGGVGRAATELRQVHWLRTVPIVYWGDIDLEGFRILSAWRTIFPQTQSLFMDAETLARFGSRLGRCGQHPPEMPPHLCKSEQRAFNLSCSDNIWLEQERIPQSEVVSGLAGAILSLTACGGGENATDVVGIGGADR